VTRPVPTGPSGTAGETPFEEVLRVLDALDAAGVGTWLEGGWGVDALVGRQTRGHRDLDVDIDAAQEDRTLTVLGELGYAVETDWRPNRVELAAPGLGRVDVHPLAFDVDGSARQRGVDGQVHHFPAEWFVTGVLEGRPVRCFSVEAQRIFHAGYTLRPVDVHDLAQLDLVSR
jgi:lincosamide nucleotidyltransferase A/C/D/E